GRRWCGAADPRAAPQLDAGSDQGRADGDGEEGSEGGAELGGRGRGKRLEGGELQDAPESERLTRPLRDCRLCGWLGSGLRLGELGGRGQEQPGLGRGNVVGRHVDGCDLDGGDLDGRNLDGRNLDGRNLDGCGGRGRELGGRGRGRLERLLSRLRPGSNRRGRHPGRPGSGSSARDVAVTSCPSPVLRDRARAFSLEWPGGPLTTNGGCPGEAAALPCGTEVPAPPQARWRGSSSLRTPLTRREVRRMTRP